MTAKENRCDYDVLKETDEYMLLRDLNLGNRSLTNDAVNVVKEIAPYLKGRKLFYKDSEGGIDEIIVLDGEFDGFIPGTPEELDME